MKRFILLLLPLLAGCKDRLDEYPNAQIKPVRSAKFSGFLVVDTNNVARVVFFPTWDTTDISELASIPIIVAPEVP